MTTYTLTMTPPDGPRSERTGLSREQALWALTDLMYPAPAEDAQPAERDERVLEPLAA